MRRRLIVRVRVAVPVPLELLALKVTFHVPVAVGVPEVKPEEVLTVRLVGSPVAPKLVGLFVAVIRYLKDVPTLPVAVEALAITGAAELMVSVRLPVPVPLPFVALSVTVKVPAVLGVPEIKPEDVLTERPAGKPVALKLVGPS